MAIGEVVPVTECKGYTPLFCMGNEGGAPPAFFATNMLQDHGVNIASDIQPNASLNLSSPALKV